MLRAGAGLVLIILVAGCDDPSTQVLVFIEADEAALGGMEAMEVRACAENEAPACSDGYRRVLPLGEVRWPARIPVGPPGDASDRFWLEASLLDGGGSPTVTVRAIAGFTRGDVRAVRLRFEAGCIAQTCDARSTCFGSACTDACFETQPRRSTALSVPMDCPGVDDAGVDAGLTDAGGDAGGCACPCGDDRCVDGACLPARPVALAGTGVYHSCAVEDGSSIVHCWGSNDDSQLGFPHVDGTPPELEPRPLDLGAEVIRLAVGRTHTCAILTDGRLFCWGGNNYRNLGITGFPVETPTEVDDPPDLVWRHIYLFGTHSCGITNQDRLFCWGRAERGQIGVFDEPYPMRQDLPIEVRASSRFEDAAVGADFTCALLLPMGDRQCWGDNALGQLSANPATVDSSARPMYAPGMWDARDIAAGRAHGCAIERDTLELRCWGETAGGKLGIGPIPGPVVYAPTAVAGGRTWSSLSLGTDHSCGIDDGGHVLCWGDNGSGRLGLSGGSRDAPAEVFPDGGWTAVSAGDRHSCAISARGELFCWGSGASGQLTGRCGRDESTLPCRICLPP